MRALCIGGTGVISSAVAELAVRRGWEVIALNRGNREVPAGVMSWQADIRQEREVAALVERESFDVVMDFIAYTREDVERDWRIFRGKTKQYIFISSASAYQKPLTDYVVNESTPLANPYWQYSRDKIACEDFLMNKYREEGFPVTVVRPSHTYCERSVPVGVQGKNGSWQVLKRMLDGKAVIVHGDGTSLWTMTHSTDFAKGDVYKRQVQIKLLNAGITRAEISQLSAAPAAATAAGTGSTRAKLTMEPPTVNATFINYRHFCLLYSSRCV